MTPKSTGSSAHLVVPAGGSVGRRTAPRKSTIADVARLSSVSPAIVSRVLNKDAALRVRPTTRERVLEAARRLHYTPDVAARALRTATSGALGLVVHDVTNPLHAETLHGAQQQAGRDGYTVLLGDAEGLVEDEERYRVLLSSGRVDGMMLQGAGYAGDGVLKRLAESTLPTVAINSQVGGPATSVVLDDVEAVRIAVQYLRSEGHEAIGFLSGRAGSPQARRRQRGFEVALQESGVALRRDWILSGGWDEVAGYRTMSRMLDRPDLPTAVVAAQVMEAIGVLAACRDRQVPIPAAISVVAIHDTWFTEHTNPPLTTVRLPLFELGSFAVELLVDRIRGGRARHVVLRDPSPVLMERGSVGAPDRRRRRRGR